MFVILDTNHYQELAARTPKGLSLASRLDAKGCDVFTTIITIQEITAGWLAEINRRKPGRDQFRAYQQFHAAVLSFKDLNFLPFDEEAVEHFHRLLSMRLRVGTLDLKIAAVAVSHEALLLTRNLVDFTKVPGLRVENWLD